MQCGDVSQMLWSFTMLRDDVCVLRDDVCAGFNGGCYSHVLPFRITNYIDGMFHVSMLLGAAIKAGDQELITLCTEYLEVLIALGPDARNFSYTPMDGWEHTGDIWVKRKPQSFAGPAALAWANRCGAGIEAHWVPEVTGQAKVYCHIGWLFGYMVRWVKALRQHVNSIFLAHLLMGKKPSYSMKWLAYDNPFYMYIYGEPILFVFPVQRKYSNGGTIYEKVKQPFMDRGPSPWPAKNWPYAYYNKIGAPANERYTPLCQLVCLYLQQSIYSVPVSP